MNDTLYYIVGVTAPAGQKKEADHCEEAEIPVSIIHGYAGIDNTSLIVFPYFLEICFWSDGADK